MIELSALHVSALTALRLLAWANVGVAAALLVAVVLWVVCCGLDSRNHSTTGA